MRVLILGGTGMLGHTVFDYFLRNTKLKVFRTARCQPENGWDDRTIIWNLSSRKACSDIADLLEKHSTDIIVNCLGKTKGKIVTIADEEEAIEINSIFPRMLARAAKDRGSKVIHISTDCIFSGKGGYYRETDEPDPNDLYGRTKLLGEIGDPHLTIRTSFIGFELSEPKVGLLEWFLSRTGSVRGFNNAMWNGLTTLELSRILVQIIDKPELTGIINIGGSVISKFQLLHLIKQVFGIEIEIEEEALPKSIKRNLSTRKMTDMGIVTKGIFDQLIELKEFYGR